MGLLDKGDGVVTILFTPDVGGLSTVRWIKIDLCFASGCL